MPSPVPDPLARARLNAPKLRRRRMPTAYIWLAVAAGGLLLLVIALIVVGDTRANRQRSSHKRAPTKAKAAPKREPIGSPWGEGRSMTPTGPRSLGDLMKAEDEPAAEADAQGTKAKDGRAKPGRPPP